MNSDQYAIIKRLRRKAEILKMDLKANGDQSHYDMNEMILLIDLLEKNQ